MVATVPRLLAGLLLVALALAGCSDGDGGEPKGSDFFTGTDTPVVQATATTGGIRGVVVDDTITPIKGATVTVSPGDHVLETDGNGLFAVSGLEPGDYIVSASHPLYNQIQQTTTVVAGDSDPAPVKLQLLRQIFATPYMTNEKFEGYIVCSAGHVFVGYSEECGEGVGSPEQTCSIPDSLGIPGVPCVDNPVMPGERIGGQGNNNVQYDFLVDSVMVSTIQVEMIWEPTVSTAASGELLTYVSTQWVCDPFCGGHTFVRGGSGSPMLLRADVVNGTAHNVTACDCDEAALTPEDLITVFTWANPDTVDPVTGEVPLATVIQNQAYHAFIIKSYVLPLPEGWSFVAGDPNPFI